MRRASQTELINPCNPDVYAFPRFSILPEHARKGFIPLTNLLKQPRLQTTTTTSKPRANSSSTKLRPQHLPTPPTSPLANPIEFVSAEEVQHHIILQGTITSLHKHHLTYTRPSPGSRRTSEPETPGLRPHTIEFGGPEETIEFEYCIYALGSGMPDPVNVWSEHPNLPCGIGGEYRERGLGSKKGGVRWMRNKADQLREAQSILIVGGGALGIREYRTRTAESSG